LLWRVPPRHNMGPTAPAVFSFMSFTDTIQVFQDMIESYGDLRRCPIVLAAFAVMRDKDFFLGALIAGAVAICG
ncbi:MAG: hypothetical protein ACKO3Q_10035, partial [Betaproteobacteria bacterium]